ncbi:hypothetical protein SS50377_20074 [Spironucleus salmonicida]|uniref:Uncharacterized protein n=1 Tax=Spironucleus salmonicida TaxID=348837 RepID=V6M011_9EUKA|nr:hypothetical protein SS50377_20074 [Spironucleus salmonicida]|eukprot:EST49356.1 hypothetical protein SS50377_10281 [Spironucleus salmonicida]
MDNLRHYFVDQNFSSISPYYEPDFCDRSSKLNVTIPFDPVQGAIYLLQQLLVDSTQTDSLSHHFAILKLLEQHCNQNHTMLLVKPLAQYCISSLYKLGQIDFKKTDILDIIQTEKTSNIRFFLLKILTKLAQFQQLLTVGFGWQNVNFEWISTPEFLFQNADNSLVSNLIYSEKIILTEIQQRYDIEQLIDKQILQYLNQNTENILNIVSSTDQFLFSAESMILIVTAMAGDKQNFVAHAALQLIITMYLNNETQIQNLIFVTNTHVHLADLLGQKVKFPYSDTIAQASQFYTQYYNDFTFILCPLLEHQGGISAMAQTKIFNHLVTLSLFPQTSFFASFAILTAIETDISIINIISRINVDFPFLLIKSIVNQFQNDPTDALRLVALVLGNTQICCNFANQIEDFLNFVDGQNFTAQSVLGIINKAAMIPTCQVKIRNWLNTDESLLKKYIKNVFQPDTSDILIQQDFLRNEEVESLKLNE